MRSAAASLAGAQKLTGLRDALLAAWQRSRTDAGDDARWSALEALAALDPAAARGPMEETLADARLVDAPQGGEVAGGAGPGQ